MHHLRHTLLSACAVALVIATVGCSDSRSATSQAVASTCATDGRTMALAVEVYLADTGAYPTSEQDLVGAGLLRAPIEDLDLVTANGSLTVVATKGGKCDGVELSRADTAKAPSASADCAVDKKVLEVALETYIAMLGVPPETEAALVGADLIRREIAGYDLRDGAVVPVDGVCA